MKKAKEQAVLRELTNLDEAYVKKFDEMFSYDEFVKLNLKDNSNLKEQLKSMEEKLNSQ